MNWFNAVLLSAALAISTAAAAEEDDRSLNDPIDTRIIDGDTIVWRGDTIRLHGIDAPEMDQTCPRLATPGSIAKDTLTAIIRRSTIFICVSIFDATLDGQIRADPYGRTVARCDADALDVGGAMVLRGWAMNDSRYSRGAYAAYEQLAKDQNLGMWRYGCEAPWEWRGRR